MVNSAHRLPFSWGPLDDTLFQDNSSCCGIIFKQMSVLSLTSTTEKEISSGRQWDSANQRKCNRNQLLLQGEIWVVWMCPACGICACAGTESLLIPPCQGVLWPHKLGLCYTFSFIKLLPDLGKKLGLLKLGLFLQKLKLAFRNMLLFHPFISLCPIRLQQCLFSFPRADCQCGLQAPISAWCRATALSASLLLILTLS